MRTLIFTYYNQCIAIEFLLVNFILKYHHLSDSSDDKPHCNVLTLHPILMGSNLKTNIAKIKVYIVLIL